MPLKMNHRLYSFVNHIYMSEKQWGIQTAHCTSNMSLYKHNTAQYAAYHEWALNSPTIIMCEGGNVAMLLDLEQRLRTHATMLQLPFTSFREDEASLGGVITAVAVLVPENWFSLNVVREEGVVRFESTVNDDVFWPGTEIHDFLSIVKLAKLA